jgi:hypothetical protein
MIKFYAIQNKINGAFKGIFEANSEDEALDKLAIESGYRCSAEANKTNDNKWSSRYRIREIRFVEKGVE